MAVLALDDVVVTAYSPDPGGGADRVVTLLGPVTLRLEERRIAVVGSNGSGKSTLARLLNGLVLPSSGTVTVDGLDTARDGAAVRRRVGFVFTDPDAQLVMPTPVEDVALSLRRLTMTAEERDVAARAALERFALADRAEVPVHVLSGGQRQLLALASASSRRSPTSWSATSPPPCWTCGGAASSTTCSPGSSSRSSSSRTTSTQPCARTGSWSWTRARSSSTGAPRPRSVITATS
ncbi:ABC-type glutathione transport system ATPase component [Cellulomonas sp. URHB0016]